MTHGFQNATPEQRQEWGRKGGQTTLLRHGEKHLLQAGIKGGAALIAKLGDKAAVREHFARLGRLGAPKRQASRRKQGSEVI